MKVKLLRDMLSVRIDNLNELDIYIFNETYDFSIKEFEYLKVGNDYYRLLKIKLKDYEITIGHIKAEPKDNAINASSYKVKMKLRTALGLDKDVDLNLLEVFNFEEIKGVSDDYSEINLLNIFDMKCDQSVECEIVFTPVGYIYKGAH